MIARGRGRGAVFGGGLRQWSPMDLGAGLKCWLRADKGITLNGANVVTWADQSGNGNNFSQTQGLRQPLYVSSDLSFNNRPVVSFSAIQDMSNDAMLVSGSDYSFIFVYKETDLVTVCNLIDSGLDNPANPRVVAYHIRNIPGRATLYVTVSNHNSDPGTQVGASQALEFQHDGTAGYARFYRAGVQLGSAVILLNTATDIGQPWKLMEASEADLAEFLIYNGILQAAQRANLAAYTTARYGV